MARIKVLFLDNSFVETDIPDEFDLASYVHGMRSIGMVLAPNFYAPTSLIKAVFVVRDGAPEFVVGITPAPNAPSSETKQ